MAHPQYNFTSNFNGSEGHNAELTLNVNGVEKKYTPAGNDKTYNVPGVACIPTNLSSDDLVDAIATAISGAALPVLIDLGADADAALYKYSGRSGDTWAFTLVTTQRVYTLNVNAQTGAITRNDISLDKSVVHVPVDHADIHAYITGLLVADQTPVLVMSDTDPDTPGVTRDFYFYPTARTGVDSDYSFIGYDGDVVKVATVHDDGTVTYATYGEQAPIDYTADVMYSPNIKVNSLGQTVLMQKGRPNRLVVKYNDNSVKGYTVTATDIQRGYISINIGLPSFYLNGELVTPNFLFSYKYKFTTSIKGLETDADKLAMFKKIKVLTYRESDSAEETLALATDFSKDEYGRSLSVVHGLVSDSIYVRTYVKNFAARGHRFERLLARYYFDYDYNGGVMANLQVGDSLGNLPSVTVILDPTMNISYQQEVGNG